MLHTKFHGNLSIGYGEKDIVEGFSPYVSVVAILVM